MPDWAAGAAGGATAVAHCTSHASQDRVFANLARVPLSHRRLAKSNELTSLPDAWDAWLRPLEIPRLLSS